MKGVAASSPASCRRRKCIGSSHIVVLVLYAILCARPLSRQTESYPVIRDGELQFRSHQPGVMHDDLGELGDLILLEPPHRAADAEAGDDATRPVMDGRADAADARMVLALGDGIAAAANRLQL